MLGLPYTINDIAVMTHARDLFQGNASQSPLRYLSFDTRSIIKGAETVFVALKTRNRDGHAFIAEAIEKGVRNFIVSKPIHFPDINYALVDNGLDAVQLWAKHHREKFSCPVIAITGSNGKTTVKELLSTLVEPFFYLVKSPMSYNSQLGVAVSLLQIHPQATLAIIEAGISQKGEMEVLAEMIQPDWGILTHMGSAHAAGFGSLEEKLSEKLLLFGGKTVLHSGNQPFVTQALHTQNIPQENIHTHIDSWAQSYQTYAKQQAFSPATVENNLLAVAAAVKLGLTLEEITPRLPLLQPVQMRSELITNNPEITLINDTYNSDPDSILEAFQRLCAIPSHLKRKVILSDIEHQGRRQKSVQKEVLESAYRLLGAENVITIGKVFSELREKEAGSLAFTDVETFLRTAQYKDFLHHVVLLKGARRFGLEQLLPFFNPKHHTTVFSINLNALIQNFQHIKSTLPEHTRIMCMVKAFSYGSGSWEIASILEQAGADYLGLAYTSEAIELRQKGIRLPMMVMNPDIESMEALVQYEIQPEIYDLGLMEQYVRTARLAGLSDFPVHIKFDTGMGRLGFSKEEIPDLIHFLRQNPAVQVLSIMTHLAAADEETEDDFTLQQLQTFQQIYEQLHTALGITPMRHALNTAGILRFPHYAMEMVRLGIGLYGINPTHTASALTEIGTLQTTISQIHTYPKGTSIGYGRSQYTDKNTRIATIPIGYADGIFRSVGNGKVSFYIKGMPAPTFGRVCMDMIMLDVTDIPEAQKGEKVLIFGHDNDTFQSVDMLAKAAGTIAYEVLTRISPRVTRVYVRE